MIGLHRFGPDDRFGAYRIGVPLFTLTRSTHGITTALQALASAAKPPRSGNLFRRIG